MGIATTSVTKQIITSSLHSEKRAYQDLGNELCVSVCCLVRGCRRVQRGQIVDNLSDALHGLGNLFRQ